MIGRLSPPGSVLAARPPESLAVRLVPRSGGLEDVGQQNSGADSPTEPPSSRSLSHPTRGDAFALSRGGVNPQNTETVDVTVLRTLSIMGGRLARSACGANMFC